SGSKFFGSARSNESLRPVGAFGRIEATALLRSERSREHGAATSCGKPRGTLPTRDSGTAERQRRATQTPMALLFTHFQSNPTGDRGRVQRSARDNNYETATPECRDVNPAVYRRVECALRTFTTPDCDLLLRFYIDGQTEETIATDS